MERTLKEQLMYALRGLKKASMPPPDGPGLNMGEMMMMSVITGKATTLGRTVNVSDLRDDGRMTGSAVSQLLNALESKGYIRRGIDSSDRRKVTVALTEHGRETLKQARAVMDRELEAVVSRLGEDETRKLIELLLRLKQIMRDVRRERLKQNGEDEPID